MTNSEKLFDLAQQYIPGGVNSPVRAFGSVGGTPLFIKSGQNACLIDQDGYYYIDYVCSWGPLIGGHCHPDVLKKVFASLENGFSFGAPTEIEVKLAERVCKLMPSVELIRFVSSGTEAAMSVIRLARGYTKRNKIVKFAGCYHGHADSLLVSAGSGALTFGVPSSAGVPEAITQHTLVAEYNDLEKVTDFFNQYGDDIAAVIVEPIAANMNLVLPTRNFLQGLRKLCSQYNSVLIFDEVITGFRVSLGGAQAYYNVVPDLTVLGKVIGGGFPAAAFGGRAEIMNYISPLGPVYQAGTLSGNPVAMTAGLATLELISSNHDFYTLLAGKTAKLIKGLQQRADEANIPFCAASVSSLFGFVFTDAEKIENENDVKNGDIELFKQFFHGMLKEGVYLAPSAFEVGFMSSAHTDQDIEKTLQASEKVFRRINKDRKCA